MGGAVIADFAVADVLLERLEGDPNAGEELFPGDLLKLGLRVVDVINVQAAQAEIFSARFQLVLDVGRRHAVTARNDVLLLDDARPEKSVHDIAQKIILACRLLSVERDEPALCSHDDLFPTDLSLGKRILQTFTDRALAALATVVHRGIDDVASEVQAEGHGLTVQPVGLFVLIAQVGADSDGGNPQALIRPVVPLGGDLGESVPVGGRSLLRSQARGQGSIGRCGGAIHGRFPFSRPTPLRLRGGRTL